MDAVTVGQLVGASEGELDAEMDNLKEFPRAVMTAASSAAAMEKQRWVAWRVYYKGVNWAGE